MFLSKAQCTGEVRLLGAHISGQLDCSEAVFTNPNGNALTADRLTVDGDMFLSKAQCTGEVRLPGAHISGQLDCAEAIFSQPRRPAVDLERASVAQEVLMRPALLDGRARPHPCPSGRLVRRAEDVASPAAASWRGLSTTRSMRRRHVKDRLRSWLPRNSYLPQPYEQLAGVYRREGNEQAARAVAIGKQRARRADVPGWRRWPSVAWSAVLRWTHRLRLPPGPGADPAGRAGLAGSLLFLIASQHPDPLHPAAPGQARAPEQPAFNSFRYTMDLLLPVVNFKQRDSFVAEGWAAWASFGFTFAGWLLAAIVVAGLTGVFKRD